MVTIYDYPGVDGISSLLFNDLILTNILVPALGLILLTFVIGLIHTIASVNLMGKGKDSEESGIPVEPYKDAPLHLKIIKNNISNIFEFSVIFYFLIGIIVFIEIESNFLLICAWLYLLFRVIHSIVHICFNNTSARGAIWIFSQTALLLLFLGTAYYVLSS